MENRIEWIDMTKGLGMILVIAGHTFALGYSAPIYSFHMPLFFFLSGLVYNEAKYNSFGKLTKAKALQLMKPWLVFYLVSLCVSLIIPVWREQLSVKQMLIELYTANSNTINNSSIWYCICLFVMFVLLYPALAVLNLLKPATRIIAIVIVGLLLLWLKEVLNIISPEYVRLIDNRLPFKMDSAAVALVFFLIGYYYKGLIHRLVSHTNWKMFFLAVVLFVVGFFVNRWSNINSMDFGRIKLLYYPIAFIGIYCCTSFCMLLSNKQSSIAGKVKSLLMYYGVNSLLIFGFQSLFIRLYIQYFNSTFGMSMELYGMNPIIHQIGSFLVVAVVTSPLIVWMFGYLRGKGINLI
ncbi:MAG: acyltransferase family protein [Prevotella sp.]|nr:acyltransferase family protein [Prevotella sp.]